MEIEITKVISKSDLRKFIYLPEQIHKNHKNWLHPLYSDDWVFFNPKKNRAFNYCDTVLVLAKKQGKIVGRIMGIIHHKYNEIHHENNARFAFFESYNDMEVFAALINYIENWAKQKGVDKIIGPFGFSDKDPQGFLVEGFDERTVMITNCNFSYMPQMITQVGFKPLLHLVQYNIPTPNEIPAIYTKVIERMNGKNYHLKEFKHIKEVKPYIIPVFELTNISFKRIYGYVPFDEKEMKDFANRFLSILDPRFIKIITKDEKVVAYIIGMPNISEGIRKARGRLFPFGFVHVLRSMKKTSQLDLLLGAIEDEHQNKGLDTLLGTAMLKSAIKAGFSNIDSHVVLESNTKMRAEYERVGGTIYKRYTVFQKDLN